MASADHVCLMEKVHPLPGEHHSTPGRHLPAFTSTLSVAKHRRLESRPRSPPTLPMLLFFFIHLICISTTRLPSFYHSSASPFSRVQERKITCTGLCSGNKHTHNLFFSVTIPHIYHHQTLLLCSSSVTQLISKCIQPP